MNAHEDVEMLSRLHALVKVPLHPELKEKYHGKNEELLPVRYLVGCFGRPGVFKKERVAQFLIDQRVFGDNNDSKDFMFIDLEKTSNDEAIQMILSSKDDPPKLIVIDHADRLCIHYKRQEVLEFASVTLPLFAKQNKIMIVCLIDQLVPENDVYLPHEINLGRQRFFANFKGSEIYIPAPNPAQRKALLRAKMPFLTEPQLDEMLMYTDYATVQEIIDWCNQFYYAQIEHVKLELTFDFIVSKVPRQVGTGKLHICQRYHPEKLESKYKEFCGLDGIAGAASPPMKRIKKTDIE
jgi:hypothetical protein